MLPATASITRNKELNSKFGTWQIPWGSINRFQRQTGAIDLKYNDATNTYCICHFLVGKFTLIKAIIKKHKTKIRKQW
jgi:hypothetical protein